MNIQEIFNPDNWKDIPTLEVLESFGKKKNKSKMFMWRNNKKEISPLNLYKYLKSRFGLPNGSLMLTKHRGTTENLFHWHYQIKSHNSKMNFIGRSAGLEIQLILQNDIDFEQNQWDLLIKNIKNDYKNYGREMSKTQNEFEHYSLFINPYTRLENTIRNQIRKLNELDISEPLNNLSLETSEDEMKTYFDQFGTWISNVEEAVSLSCSVKMLTPVLGEAFINLILELLCKDDLKNDKRMFDSIIKQQIDVRVKSLHLHCNGIKNPIDSKSDKFKNFHTIMNGRNDFLHGNIDPQKLMFEDVYFDDGDTPLFKEDNGIISKTMNNYLNNMEPKTAVEDFKKINEFIEHIISHFTVEVQKIIRMLMVSRMPAFNKKTNKIAVLFSPGLAEGHI